MKPLNRIQRNLTGSKISTSSTKFVFFGPIGKTRWPPWPLIGWDIFDFSSETAEWNSTKLKRKQDLNVLYQVCVFRADRKKQDGRPGLWLAETFSTSHLKPLNGIQRNLTGSKISTSSSEFVFFGPISKQKCPPWIPQMADSSKRWHIVLRCTICGPLGLLFFDMFWCCTVLDLVISTYFNPVNGAKCLIHINLCTESDLFPFHVFKKKNSTRLQWYSCARYKAPGPLVLGSRDACPGSLCRPWCWSLCRRVAWTKTLTLAIIFLPEVIGISYCTRVFLVTRPFTLYHIFYIVTLTLKFDLLLKNFNLGHNCLTRRDRAFILHMCIPCDKTFHMVP